MRGERKRKKLCYCLYCAYLQKKHTERHKKQQQAASKTHTYTTKKNSVSTVFSQTQKNFLHIDRKVSMSNATTEDSEWMDEDKSCCDKYGKDMYEWHESVACESWDWKRKLTGRRSTRAFS